MGKYKFLEPFEFKNGLKVKNKVFMSPMTTMSSYYNGMISSDEVKYYAARSGGVGAIITAVAYVSENGKGFEGELSVASDEMIPGLSNLAYEIKRDGAKAILQIFHAGRKTFKRVIGGEEPVAPSSIKASYPANSDIPRELEEDEIIQIIKDFGDATRRAISAGFDGIELHGANTYLLQQFYSENSNQREDCWGGDRDARMTFAKKVISEVNSVIKENTDRPFLVGYRISPEEIEKPGIQLNDSLHFVETIKGSVDYIHLSIGSYMRSSLNNKDDSELIITKFKKVVDGVVPIIGVGSVVTPEDANKVLSIGADIVAIGRELIREPQWVQKVINNDVSSIRTSISPSDMNELMIPNVMQVYLKESFSNVMNFTEFESDSQGFEKQVAPMEGFEKKL